LKLNLALSAVKNLEKQIEKTVSYVETANLTDPFSLKTITPLCANNKSWNIQFNNYLPTEFTSENVLLNPKSDFDILNKNCGHLIRFNIFDELNDVERRSCLGNYPVVDNIPLNPRGRTGIKGRGSLLYWGPNHFVELVFTCGRNEKNIEFIASIEGESNEWAFPKVKLYKPI